MEISNAHQYQAMGSSSSNILPLEEVLVGCSKTSSSQQHQEMRKVMKPHPDQSLKCPRCDSTNTKFCYYNNYSLSQPRYYCKGCRRYWTKGGSLRNVPIGGGCRKNKKSSSSSSSSSSSTSSKRPQDSNSNPHLSSFMAPSHLANYDPSHDHLTLAFADLHNHKQPLANGFFVGNPSSGSSSSGFLDILRGGFVNSVANNQSDWNSLYGIGCNGDGVQEVEDVVMPFNVGFDGGTTYTTTTTTTSAHDNMAAAMDSGRDYWNGVAPPPPPSWHGLINNSLM